MIQRFLKLAPWVHHKVTSAGLLTALLWPLLSATVPPAHAQTVPRAEPGWQFSVSPYAWLPAIDGTLRHNLPTPSGTNTADVRLDQAGVLEALDFAAFITAEARYERFSIVTDFIYMDLGATDSKVRDVKFPGGGGTEVSANLDLGTDSSLSGNLWTLMGGYTVAQGEWGHADIVGGFRLFSLNAETNVRLAAVVTGPGGPVVLDRTARLSDRATWLDGLIGTRGRLVIGNGFHVPYAFDIGAGSSTLTWQASAALGYQFSWGSVALGYRHLAYEQGSKKLVQSLSFGGPFLGLNFTF